MNFKAWKIGIVIALVFSLLTAGAGLTQDMNWKSLIAVFCASALTNLAAYLMKHPVEQVKFESEPEKPFNGNLPPPPNL